MPSLSVERDTEILIDNQLKNLGWNNDPHAANRNVYQQRVKTDDQKKKLQGKRPDYILYPSNSNDPIAIIEAKRQGQNIHDAMRQGIEYAQKLDAPIVFATDGVFTKTVHIKSNRPLFLNGEEIDELIRETLALKYLTVNEVNTLDKKVVKSRGELISIFSTVNDLLREEGLQQGLERFTEFANILFLKVLSEIEDGKEEHGERSNINKAYRWDSFREKKGNELLSYIWYHDYPIWASDCTVLYSANEKALLTKYLYHILKSKQNEIHKLQHGAGQPHVYWTDLCDIHIPVPDIKKQQELVSDLETIEKRIGESMREIDKNKDEAVNKIKGIWPKPVSKDNNLEPVDANPNHLEDFNAVLSKAARPIKQRRT